MDGALSDPENVPDPVIYRAWLCWPGGGGCSRVVSGRSRERERESHRKRKLAKSALPSLQRASIA